MRDTSGQRTARLIAVVLCAGVGLGFGEEPGLGIGADQQSSSTHHLHLTRALAVCAGFSHTVSLDPLVAPRDAERIAIFDALTDQEHLRGQDGTRYSLCTAVPYELPTNPAALGCPPESGMVLVMPLVGRAGITALAASRIGWAAERGCFASRYGPYSSLFHFPTADELESLRGWAFGDVARPQGRAQFVFGGHFDLLWNADCYAERIEVVDTGTVGARSLEALGIYLHAVADRASHGVCIAAWGTRATPPWPTHTALPWPRGCMFLAHSRELGCPQKRGGPLIDQVFPAQPDFVANSIAAAEHVYAALLAYGRATGRPPRVRNWHAHSDWLPRQVERFVLSYSYARGAPRRAALAHALAQACAALAPETDDDACLDDATTDAPSDFDDCPYPLTPPCEAAKTQPHQ